MTPCRSFSISSINSTACAERYAASFPTWQRNPKVQHAGGLPTTETHICRSANDPTQECRPISLSAGGHLDADCHELPRLPVPEQPQSTRARTVLARFRAHPGALHHSLDLWTSHSR